MCWSRTPSRSHTRSRPAHRLSNAKPLKFGYFTFTPHCDISGRPHTPAIRTLRDACFEPPDTRQFYTPRTNSNPRIAPRTDRPTRSRGAIGHSPSRTHPDNPDRPVSIRPHLPPESPEPEPFPPPPETLHTYPHPIPNDAHRINRTVRPAPDSFTPLAHADFRKPHPRAHPGHPHPRSLSPVSLRHSARTRSEPPTRPALSLPALRTTHPLTLDALAVRAPAMALGSPKTPLPGPGRSPHDLTRLDPRKHANPSPKSTASPVRKPAVTSRFVDRPTDLLKFPLASRKR